MNKLFIVGDSFASEPPVGDDYKPWFRQAGDLLNLEVENYSMIGVSQDWCFWKLSHHLKELTADDQVLVVMTHPGRFWFFDNKPQMTNPNIVNIDRELSKEELEAVKGYMMYIQRPPLDTQLMSYRLGWLNSQIERYKLKPAHVLCAFPLIVNIGYDLTHHEDWKEYKNIIISKGDLQNCIQIPEVDKTKEKDEYAVWKGYDCRYNHLLKTNHKILAKRVAEGIQNKNNIDLVTEDDWLRGVIHNGIFEDQDFIDKELEQFAVTSRAKYIKNNFQKPWMDRVGMTDFFKKKGLR